MKSLAEHWKAGVSVLVGIVTVLGIGWGAASWADEKIKDKVASTVKQIKESQQATAEGVKENSRKLDRLMEILIRERRN